MQLCSLVYSLGGGDGGGGGGLCNKLFSELSASVLLLREANFIHRVACDVSIIHRVVVTSVSFTVCCDVNIIHTNTHADATGRMLFETDEWLLVFPVAPPLWCGLSKLIR